MQYVNVSILKRGQQSWRIKTRVKRDGVWSEQTETLRGSEAEAEVRKAEILSDFRSGKRHQLTLDTVEAYATCWIDYRLAVGTIRPSTARNYRIMLKPWVEALGDVKLTSLTTDQCRSFVAKDATRNGVKAARQRHVIAKACLSAAVKEGKISINPYARFDAPKVQKAADKPTISDTDMRAIYAASYDHDLTGLAIRIAVSTGLRRGELAALRWGDVERGRVHVRLTALRGSNGTPVYAEPKTSASIRSVSIPSSLSEELEQRRGDPEDLVLQGVTPDTLSRRVGELLPDGFTIHDLRHAHATALLQAGIPVKAVSIRLGHCDVKTTLQVYSHAMPKDDEAAVNAVDAIVGKASLRVMGVGA